MPNYVLRKSEESPDGDFYVYWSDKCRQHRTSTFTADKVEADAFFREWLKASRDDPTLPD